MDLPNTYRNQPTKRAYLPTLHSAFGDTKKLKIGREARTLPSKNAIPSNWEHLSELHEQCQQSEPKRHELINLGIYGHPFPQKHTQNPPKAKVCEKLPRRMVKAKRAHMADCSQSVSTANTLQPHRENNSLDHPQFKARSVPQFPPPCFSTNPKPTTQIMPFPFQIVDRPREISHSNVFDTTFTANPVPDFSHPFRPIFSQSQTTVPEPFSLHTQDRHFERVLFEEKLREKERSKELEKQQQEIERGRKEQEEIKKLRKNMQFKAQGIRNFSQVPQFNPRPCTVTQSPQLLSARMALNDIEQNLSNFDFNYK